MSNNFRVLCHLFALTLPSFFLLASMCTKPVEPAKPVVSKMPKDSASASRDSVVAAKDTAVGPLLLEFNVPGIPKENVVINQKYHTITVTLPPTVPAIELMATTKTTPGYYVNDHNRFAFKICSGIAVPRLFREKDGIYTDVQYGLVMKRGGDVKISDAKAPYDYVAGTSLRLTGENLYDTEESFGFIATNKQSGKSYDGYTDIWCQANIPNVVYARFLPNVPAGEYTLTVEMKNGRRMQVAQPIIIKPGLPVFYTGADVYNPDAPGKQNIRFTGYNLYEADTIEFLFRNGKGNRYRIVPNKYYPDGLGGEFDLPATILPSQYNVQLIRHGKPEAVYDRILIQTPDRKQPQFVYIADAQNNRLLAGDPEKPIPLQYGSKYGFNYVHTTGSAVVRIRLTSTGDKTKTYLIDIDQRIIDAYNQAGPGVSRPWFIIPASIPGGRYQLSLQFTDLKGNVVEGDPLERDIDVQ